MQLLICIFLNSSGEFNLNLKGQLRDVDACFEIILFPSIDYFTQK